MLLTAQEAAVLLSTTERQVYRWIDEGSIPFERVRDQVRFNRTELLEWATSKGVPVSPRAFDADDEAEARAPSLAAALRRGGVHLGVPATDRDAALRAVVERTPMPPSLDPDFVVEVLVARENLVSTALGDGIAIPHVRQPLVAPGAEATVSVSHLSHPVPFGAADPEPVRIVFLIVSPTIRAHLQLLAQVARALVDKAFRAALERRASAEELAAEAARLEAAPRAPRDARDESD